MKPSAEHVPFTVLALASLLTLGACSGGGGGSASASTSSPVVSHGAVTALGSVVVNGVRFNTDNATVRIDDNPSASDLLKVGMVVTVRGSSDDAAKSGTATEIEARDLLEGTISAVGTNTLTVMGQTIQFEDNVTRLNDDDTLKVFADGNFQVGDFVEVHGFADDQAGIRATRLLTKASGEFETKGFIISLGAGSFGLGITPGGASVLTVTGALPLGAGLGSYVEVRASSAPVGNAVTATSVSLEDALGGVNEKVEVEGIVTTGDGDAFTIRGQAVITTAATFFEGGLKADVVPGAKVEAEGPLNASGVIVAVKVSFRSNLRLEGDASAVSATSLTVLGKPVALNAFTRIDNGPIAGHLEIRAMLDRNGALLATRVTVQSASTKAFLQGPVTAADPASGNLTILGTTISTTGAQFRLSSDSNDTPVTRAAFFAQLKPDITVVKVKWDPFSSLAAPVKEAEIELGH